MSKVLTKFVFKKLIYDYLSGKLDPKISEKFIKKMNSEPDCLDEVKRYEQAFNQVKNLDKVKLASGELDDILFAKSEFNFQKSFLENSTVLNAFKLAIVLVFIVSLYFMVQLVPVKKFDVAGLIDKFKPAKVVQMSATPLDPILSNIYGGELNQLAQKALQFKKIEDESQENQALQASRVQQMKAKLNQEQTKPKKGPQGHLYRVYMSLKDLEQNSQKIIAMIESFEGSKAGQKPLGYIKKKGRYFHLQLPSAKKAELMASLEGLGRVRIDHERHWRKMPEGITRVIVWIEDLDLKAQRLKADR